MLTQPQSDAAGMARALSVRRALRSWIAISYEPVWRVWYFLGFVAIGYAIKIDRIFGKLRVHTELKRR